ncbi:hypothetical protein D3C75_1104790 [compost metagenome]
MHHVFKAAGQSAQLALLLNIQLDAEISSGYLPGRFGQLFDRSDQEHGSNQN